MHFILKLFCITPQIQWTKFEEEIKKGLIDYFKSWFNRLRLYGTMHANCYKALADKVEVVAVADLRDDKAKEIADMFGAKIYADGEDLIKAENVDFVDICLPT